MSFFADLLGNAAIAGGKHLQGEIDEDRNMARLDHASELASARDRTIKELALEFANKARTDEVASVDERAAGLIASRNPGLMGPQQPPTPEETDAFKMRASEELGFTPRGTGAATAKEESRYAGGLMREERRDAATDAYRKAQLGQGAGERKLRLESLQMDVAQKKEASNLLTKYENATDPTVKAALRESLVMRGIIKQGDKDYDTQKVTTDVTDDQGNTTKTERTEKVPRVSKEGAPTPEPSQAQIDLLLKNPKKRAGFDAVYGAGMSEKYLPKGGGAKSAPMTADNIRIGKDLGIQQPWFGPKRRVYEVTTPDGGTKEMGTDELRELGVQMPSLNGQLYYDPNYNKK